MKDRPPRLNGSSYVVLALLQAKGEATPYDLKRFLEQSVQNFWPVPHTTFYAEPARLARAGYLSETQEAGGRRRKVYALTDAGRAALEEWAGEAETSPPQLRDDAMLKIFAGADPLPLLAARLEWHRAKLAELEGYVELAEHAGPGREGPGLSLQAGIAYHRVLGDAIAEFLDRPPEDA